MSLTARKSRFYGVLLVLTSLIISIGLGEIVAVLLLIGANDFWQPISMDRQYRSFPGVEKLPLGEYEALMDRSFAVWPHADSHFPFFKRTAIWRTAHASTSFKTSIQPLGNRRA